MKGLFIPEITAEMLRNGCLENIDALIADDKLYDINCPEDLFKKQTDEIKIGEMLIDEFNDRCIVVNCMHKTPLRTLIRIMYSDGSTGDRSEKEIYENYNRTGIRFSQIAEILEQMKGDVKDDNRKSD